MEEKNIQFSNQKPRPQSFFAKNRVWLNVLLFVVTVFTTFFIGFSWSMNYVYADRIIQDVKFSITPEMMMNPQIIFLSMLYAIALIGVLLGHELGHFLTCRYYKIDATLPYFIPAPTLIGTLGAFIKIKSPITQKRQLFDIGIAGPLTGFILSVPTLIYGLSLSKVVPSIPREESIIFGEPLLLKIAGSMIFKGVSADFDVILHPVAFAGWVGILVTALNLFPIGQLDGGHIFYALVGQRAKKFYGWILAAFIIMGVFFWIGWFIWVLLISVLGLKHPHIIDEDVPLSPRRKFLVFVVLIIFVLSFIPDPIKGYTLFDILKQFSF